MSAVATANAAAAPGLAALLGGAPDGGGFGQAAGAAASFGAALAVAERMLDVGGDIVLPADAAIAAPTDVAVPAEQPDLKVAIDAGNEGPLGSNAGLSAASAVLAAPPIAPPVEPLPRLVAPEGATPEAAQTVAAAHPVTMADTTKVMEAEAAVPVAAPATAAAPVAHAAPAAHAQPTPASLHSRTSVDSGALPVAAAALPMQKDGSARPDQSAPPVPLPQTPPASAPAPAVPVSPTGTPIITAPDAAAAVPRAVAAQVAPVVLSIIQRPVGSHQLTMTVNPDTLGPVTVRAHISAGGEVRVELLGATDAGRDALRSIVTDLRRDLAAVMPHASLALGPTATASDASTPDRGAHPGSGGAGGEQAPGERGRADTRGHPAAESSAGGIPSILPITTRAVSGEGLDIFA
ncbi:flagellar hook-length control protein FliK [Microbacterium oxydans]|uniref:Flagellar hook-length control protein FliK n=1 Tax=Microbacterium oxydans TaxID=82380 RepID=A0A0F0L3Q3_9MICO|nr:flagellar hook-length control protein FliK [Microbacterium oxydans]KJL27773.1 Flagellar hook-length control protein FliK [Microbacterium oxydans]